MFNVYSSSFMISDAGSQRGLPQCLAREKHDQSETLAPNTQDKKRKRKKAGRSISTSRCAADRTVLRAVFHPDPRNHRSFWPADGHRFISERPHFARIFVPLLFNLLLSLGRAAGL